MALAVPRPPNTSRVAVRVPRGFSFARRASGVTSAPRTLISSVPISCFAISRLRAFRSSDETSRTSKAVEEWAIDQVVSGQVVNPIGETVQVMRAGEAVEQAGTDERRVGIVDERAGRGDGRTAIGRVRRGRSR